MTRSTAIMAAFLLLAGGYTVGAKANHEPDISALLAALEDQQEEIAELRQAVEDIEIPETEPVIREVIREIEVPVLIEVPVTEIVEIPVYIEPEEPSPEQISYRLVHVEDAGGTFSYSFSGYTLTARFYPMQQKGDGPGLPKDGGPGKPKALSGEDEELPEPITQDFDLSVLWRGGLLDPGELPVDPVLDAWIAGEVIYLDLIGSSDTERMTIPVGGEQCAP